MAITRNAWIGSPGIATAGNLRYMGDQSETPIMERSTELRIKGHLYEIGEIDEDVIGNRQGFHSAEAGYRRTLESVADCADTEMVDRIAGEIKTHIQNRKERPANQSVRKNARRTLVEAEILPDSYLNEA